MKSVVRDALGRPKIADANLADDEWAANIDHSKASPAVIEAFEKREAQRLGNTPPPEPTPEQEDEAAPRLLQGASLSEAKATDAYWKAKNEELKFRTAAKELVEAKDVEREWVAVISRIKTKLLAVPTRVKQSIPELTVPQVAGIDRLLREVLEELADDR